MKYIKIYESPNMPVSVWDALDAIETGKIDKLKRIIKIRPEVVNVKYNGGTLLFGAIDAISLDSVIELTNAGANWFIKNDRGKYFFDFLNDVELNELKKLFPDKFRTKEYKDWELEQVANKYNI
jgi:hypothetical protein